MASTLTFTGKVGPDQAATATVVPFRKLEFEDDSHIIRTIGYDGKVTEVDASEMTGITVTLDAENNTVDVTVAG